MDLARTIQRTRTEEVMQMDPLPVELLAAAATTLWAVWSIFDPQGLEERASWRILSLIADEAFWQSTGLALGICKSIIGWRLTHIYREGAAYLGLFWWGLLFACVVSTGQAGPGVGIFLVFVTGNLYSLLWNGAQRKRR